ncbi:hypothetical protein [Methylocystis rosea]|uniref:hypothetical protein n=1 Tax=Methylocystis rosea TaxID=173366 RepID=UPI00037675B9|nr:hypothetical protein [Methylocystis rosea]
MTVVDDRVNSVLAAVLSASIVPIHGALAQEQTPSGQRAVARLPATLPVKGELSLQDFENVSEPVSMEPEMTGYQGA